LIKAEAGANKVYTAFRMSYTTPHGNPAFVPVAAFTNTGLETEQYYFHPDHLGSSNYITNIAGEVSQHTEYFAFGETFVEEHKGSNNSPYKFNGKELDAESGLYYYGARYYDPRISIWASVDPLADYNPHMNKQFYFNGQHNGGLQNSFNHASYSYCYQSPVKLIDPNGKQAFFMHGTGDWKGHKNHFGVKLQTNLKKDFGSYNYLEWSGSLYDRDDAFWNGKEGRVSAGHRVGGEIMEIIKKNIINGKYVGKGIMIGGHSHGGNVARVAANDIYGQLLQMVGDGKLDKMPTINLLLLNTPTLQHDDDYRVDSAVNIIQVDSKLDLVAGTGQGITGNGAIINESYNDANHTIEYEDQMKDWSGADVGNHLGRLDCNADVWYPEVKKVIKK
jgi:RHS repeat-associated protein